MIATSKVSKQIEYYNVGAFYDELSKYRTEISDSISNYRFSDTLIMLKKMIGYFWRPEEVDLQSDRRDFLNLPANEKHIFLSLFTKLAVCYIVFYPLKPSLPPGKIQSNVTLHR